VAEKVRTVVMGHCGTGKTSLFNGLCQKQYQTGFTNGSLTRDIDFADVAWISNSRFRMYDTPGTDST
jgi:predicted GTPase